MIAEFDERRGEPARCQMMRHADELHALAAPAMNHGYDRPLPDAPSSDAAVRPAAKRLTSGDKSDVRFTFRQLRGRRLPNERIVVLGFPRDVLGRHREIPI